MGAMPPAAAWDETAQPLAAKRAPERRKHDWARTETRRGAAINELGDGGLGSLLCFLRVFREVAPSKVKQEESCEACCLYIE